MNTKYLNLQNKYFLLFFDSLAKIIIAIITTYVYGTAVQQTSNPKLWLVSVVGYILIIWSILPLIKIIFTRDDL